MFYIVIVRYDERFIERKTAQLGQKRNVRFGQHLFRYFKFALNTIVDGTEFRNHLHRIIRSKNVYKKNNDIK